MSLAEMNLQPTLEDHLVLLRPLEVSDYEELYQIAKDPLIWKQHQIKNRYQKEVYQKFFRNSITSKGALVAIDKKNNNIIGSSRFKKIDKVEYAIEIGWSFLSRNYWGGIYNSSIKTLMIDHAFRFIASVVFYIDIHNIRSQKAVEKIGGKRIIGNQWNDLIKKNNTDITYLILKEGWYGQKSKH